MTTLRWLTLPFRYTSTSDFYIQLNKWLSDVYYNVLPQAGYEIREEQIYSCYRMVNALSEKGVLMAEAGSGTGKSFAYLLPALCYARMTGKPVVIACSSATLQEQLVQPMGDIATLSRLLDLDVKAVLAKDPVNYACALQANMAKLSLPEHPMHRKLVNWLDSTQTGDRVELPEIDDQLWQEISFNHTLDCSHCRRRGFCHLARARQRLWDEHDFIICSHDVFFRDLWTRRERQQKEVIMFGMVQSKVPYLPHYSAAVLDEGHLIEAPALSNLGVRLTHSTVSRITNLIPNFPLVTDELLLGLEKLELNSKRLFAAIKESVLPITPTQGQVDLTGKIPGFIGKTILSIDKLQEEMAMYQQFDINQYIQELDLFAQGLKNLISSKDIIAWWDTPEESLWVLPQDFSGALGRELLAQKKPVIFTSATLDTGDEFGYFKRITGISQAKTSQVTTSFALAQQMTVYMPADQTGIQQRIRRTVSLLRQNGGRALVLVNTAAELKVLSSALRTEQFDFNLLWEGSGDSAGLVQRFRQDRTSVLLGTSFWEGVDVPGDALTLVIVYSLPFPAHDPLVLAKREAAVTREQDPYLSVDLPAMNIKLRQGLGRLIRSAQDFGIVAVLDGGSDPRRREQVISVLPSGVAIVESDKELSFQDISS